MEEQNNTNFNNTDDFNILGNSSQCDTESILHVVELIIVCTGLPLMLVAICAVLLLVRSLGFTLFLYLAMSVAVSGDTFNTGPKDHSAPVYVINLLISDLIQLCCLTAWKACKFHAIIEYSYTFAVMASVGFMVCISMERYLVIAKPLWYRFRRNIKTPLMVCAVVWTLALFVFAFFILTSTLGFKKSSVLSSFSSPPLFIFFLVGTIKALSAAHSVPAEEKRRIVAILVAVLLIYTLLFLPNITWSLVKEAKHYLIFTSLACIGLYLSPLTDLTMYFCIRKSAIDKLLKLICHCKMSGNRETSSTAVEHLSATGSEAV